MKGKGILLLTGVIILFASCSHKINPQKPTITVTDSKLDSLPESEITIPIQIDLQPLYAMAEKNVDTLFTTPNYPDDWAYDGCSSRYKYTFRRSPLQVKAIGNTFNLGFTGYYKVIGSTRACVNGTAISPWTPPCKCGFSEGERKVSIAFSNSFSILPDYKIKMAINRLEPKPLNKCEVCFWGQDITSQVMKNLKEELDGAKADMEKKYGSVDLRPSFQQLWDQLNKVYDVYGLGWLKINPQRIRINNIYAQNDSLNISLGIAAKPIVSFEKPDAQNSAVPLIDNFPVKPGFSIFVDAILQYDSLSNILNQQMSKKQFTIDKGPVKKTFIVNQCKISGAGDEKVIIKIDFTGSADGTAYLIGKPTYDPIHNLIQISDLDFDVKTKDRFLRTAEWLFNRKIINEISKYTRFELTSYMDAARFNINNQLNKDWIKGVKSYGSIFDVRLTGVYTLNQYLVIRSNLNGYLSMKIDAVNFNL